MTALVQVNLGTIGDGSDGDALRTAMQKINTDIGILQTQATLTSATTITAAQIMTVAAHIGKRVIVNLAAAGNIGFPAASTCAADSTILLCNQGAFAATLVITSGSGDTIGLAILQPGEASLFGTDGVHKWNCLLRGRSINANETVSGNLTVTGTTALTGGVAGATNFSVRPTFNANAAWDAGNLDPTIYMPKAGGVYSAAPTYASIVVARAAYVAACTGKVLIVGFHQGATFTGSAPVVFAAEVDQTTSWGSSNTFVPPVTGIYRIQANLLISSAPASGTQITLGLAKSSDNSVVYNEVFICDGRSFFNIRFEFVKQLIASTGYYIQLSPTASVTTSGSTTSSRFSIEQVA